MVYNIIPQDIPQERRREINEKILFSIDEWEKQTAGRSQGAADMESAIPRETIYNTKTITVGGFEARQSKLLALSEVCSILPRW